MADKKPEWLKVGFNAERTKEVRDLMDNLRLNTVCREANCPNLGECYKHRTATFMILGSICTRNCRYCDVTTGRPEPVDPAEPENLALAAKQLNLKHVVITSVDRDDLPDGGAGHFAEVIRQLRKHVPGATVEVLIPDFQGNEDDLMTVLEAGPDVLNHNIECVREVFEEVRPQGDYDMSLEVLRRTRDYANAHGGKPIVKTGAMLGLGETDEQLRQLFRDLVENGTDLLTLGQYLRPSPKHVPVDRYVTPATFDRYRDEALEAGLAYVVASPLVRSSYRAEEALTAAMNKRR